MTVRDLQRRFEYGYWANAKLLAVVSQLTPEQFTQHVAGSYGSIRNTLVHTLSAEWGWLDRCGGLRRGSALKGEDYATTVSLTNRWCEIERAMRTFLSQLTPQDLDRMVEFSFGAGPTHAMRVEHLLRHSANHAAHHR